MIASKENLKFNWRFESKQIVLEIIGHLTLSNIPVNLPSLGGYLPSNSSFIIDAKNLLGLDTSAVNDLLAELQELGFYRKNIIFQNINPNDQKIFELVSERSDLEFDNSKTKETFLYKTVSNFGQSFYEIIEIIHSHLILLGQLISSFFYYLRYPNRIRFREVFSQIEQTGINAIPVILLVNFLIGIVITYLLAMQAEKFGASIFVVDGVALAMCREMSPILVSIILAGRSGSAFTAQLGAMKLTEETDALQSLGLKYFDVLIFPRIFSLLLCLPLLVFLGDIIGIYGGMLIAEQYLNLSNISFLQRLEQVLTIKHIIAGLIKAPFFALAIGLIACRVGMEVAKDARSVGLSTTKTVVRSIVIVILINAAFSVFFANIGF